MRRPRYALILIAFLAFISLGLPDGVLGIAWPSIRRTFGLPVSQMGVLLTTLMLGSLISSFGSGAIVARIGVGKVLLFSSLLVALASAGYALAPAWPVMVGIGLFLGLGSGAIDAGINAYAAREFSPRVVNWLHAFYGVGATLGPVLMTAVLSAGLVWRWGYAINAMLLAGMAVCFLFTLTLWAPIRDPQEGESRVGRSPLVPEKFFTTLRRPVVRLSVIFFFFYTGVEAATGQWAYTLLTESRGVAPAVAGTWVAIYWGSLTIGRIVFGAVAGHVSPLLLIRGAMIVAPLAAALLWANLWAPTNFLGLSLMGFSFAPMFPTLISLTPGRVGPAAAQQAVGFQIAAAALGAAGVPGFVGIIARKAGFGAIAPALFGLAIMLLVMHEWIVRTTRRPLAPTSAEFDSSPSAVSVGAIK